MRFAIKKIVEKHVLYNWCAHTCSSVANRTYTQSETVLSKIQNGGQENIYFFFGGRRGLNVAISLFTRAPNRFLVSVRRHLVGRYNPLTPLVTPLHVYTYIYISWYTWCVDVVGRNRRAVNCVWSPRRLLDAKTGHARNRRGKTRFRFGRKQRGEKTWYTGIKIL